MRTGLSTSRSPLRESLAKLGIRVTEISQTQMYTSGAYTEQIILAMRRRADIGAIIRRYQTKQTDVDEEARADYYPFRPYCVTCGRDDTTVTAFDDDTAQISYTCRCGATVGPVPIGQVRGKLVWKVDWPMRWAYERVTFEPAGVDHASPGSSFTVGQRLVEDIFGGEMPLHFGYSFVGTQGSAKMSGSAGGAPTPKDALEIFEAPLVRWLYARRRPEQSITLAFGTEVGRVYDEWDALTRKVNDGTAEPGAQVIYTRASSTADGKLPQTPRPMSFRTLASIFDITAGDEEQELRILRDLTPDAPITSLERGPAAARLRPGLGARVRAGRGPHDGAGRAGPPDAGQPDRAGPARAEAASGPDGGALVARRADHAAVRDPEADPRAADRRAADV